MDDQADDLRWWLALWRTPGIGAIKYHLLLQHFHSPKTVFREFSADTSINLPGKTRACLAKPDWQAVEQDLAWLAGATDRYILCFNDPLYPPCCGRLLIRHRSCLYVVIQLPYLAPSWR